MCCAFEGWSAPGADSTGEHSGFDGGWLLGVELGDLEGAGGE